MNKKMIKDMLQDVGLSEEDLEDMATVIENTLEKFGPRGLINMGAVLKELGAKSGSGPIGDVFSEEEIEERYNAAMRKSCN